MTKSRKLNAPARSAAGSCTVVRPRFEGDTLDTVFRFWVGLPKPPVRAHYPRKFILRGAHAAEAFLAAVQPVLAVTHPAVECFRNESDPKWEALTDVLGMLGRTRRIASLRRSRCELH
ncbi:MAG: hypothetical protein SF172_10050 [Burkholderiales bacterium]|nr:hypothetical protein [Burkholderiales bacterium]